MREDARPLSPSHPSIPAREGECGLSPRNKSGTLTHPLEALTNRNPFPVRLLSKLRRDSTCGETPSAGAMPKRRVADDAAAAATAGARVGGAAADFSGAAPVSANSSRRDAATAE